MSVSAWVSQTEQVLARARSLFADPATSGGTYADQSSATLFAAADQTQINAEQRTFDSGRMATRYQAFTATAIPQSQTVATDDATLRSLLDQAANVDRQGLRASTAILNAASTEIADLAPVADTPAGERAMIQALRDRVAEQQQVLHHSSLRAAELTEPLQFLYHPTGVVVDEPPPQEDPPPGGILCYIGTKDGDPAQICAGYDVSQISYIDDAGRYVIEDAQTGDIIRELPIGSESFNPTACWLPGPGADRSVCSPETTTWGYPDANGNLITETLNPDTGEREITINTPPGPITP